MIRSTSGKACDACRRRKLKCSRTLDNPSPVALLETSCVRCIQTDLRCTFNDEQRKRGPRTGKRLRTLRSEQQLSNLEGIVNEREASGSFSDSSDLTSPLSLGRDEGRSLISDSYPGSTLICTEDTQNAMPLISCTSSPAYCLVTQSPTAVAAFDVLDSTPLDFTLEENTMPNDQEQELLNEEELQLWSQPDNGFPISKGRLLEEISLFFDQGYVAYPLLHHETLMRYISKGSHLSDPECGNVMLSVVMLNQACKLRQSPQHDPFTMHFLAKTIESRRTNLNGDHFSENPSIDAVIISVFLFIVFNVSEKHNRAFCYLTEAIGLFDLIGEPSDPVEAIRLQRLEYVLFIAESATVSIYGSQRKRMISRRPSDPLESASSLYWYNQETEVEDSMKSCVKPDMAIVDRQAVDLLLLMTRLHLATDVTQVARITVDDRLMFSVSRDFDSDGEIHNSRYTTQTADVAITRQWKLADLWWNDMSHRSARTSSSTAINSTIEMIGTTTLTWSKTLPPGHLRIVGLGKVVALTESILNISSKLGIVGSCTSLIRHLIHTVAETDYDQYFAPQLSMTEIRIGDIPRSLISNEEFEQFIHDTEVGLV